MKPRYQLRKKIVPGITKRRRRWTSSWNSGDRSIASQSTGGCAMSSPLPATTMTVGGVLPAGSRHFVANRSRVDRCDERRLRHDERRPLDRRAAYARARCYGDSPRSAGARGTVPRAGGKTGLDVALGVVLGMVLAASLAAGWRLFRAPRVLDRG